MSRRELCYVVQVKKTHRGVVSWIDVTEPLPFKKAIQRKEEFEKKYPENMYRIK